MGSKWYNEFGPWPNWYGLELVRSELVLWVRMGKVRICRISRLLHHTNRQNGVKKGIVFRTFILVVASLILEYST